MERVVGVSLSRGTALFTGVVVAVFVLAAPVAKGSSVPGVQAPTLGKTIDLIPVHGQVFVGSARARHRVSAATQIRVGSIVDVRAGQARLIVAYGRAGRTRTGTFTGGQLRISQTRAGHGVVEVQLVGGSFARCGQGRAASRRQTGIIRRTRAVARYPFAVRGRSGAGGAAKPGGQKATDASAGNAVWETADMCAGTMIQVSSGRVDTEARGANIQFQLLSRQSVAYGCANGSGSPAFCVAVRGLENAVFNDIPVPGPSDQFTLVTREPAEAYALVITRPNGSTSSVTYPLGQPGPGGYRRSDVLCVPDQGAGTYRASWSLNGELLPAFTYRVPAGSPNVGPCSSEPFSRGIPSDLDQQVDTSHFAVFYSADPTDPNFVQLQTATNVANTAEQAYGFDTTTLAMPSYVDGGDGKVDIYLEASIGASGQTLAAPPAGQNALPGFGSPTAAYIVLRPGALATDPFEIPVTVFWALEDGIGRIIPREHAALSGSIGWWAAANFLQSAPSTPTLNQPLDCDSSCAFAAVNRHWRFYQHLAEKFGNALVPQILSADAAMLLADPAVGHMDDALQSVLVANGSSLAAELAAYTLENLTNGWLAQWVGGGGLSNHSFGSVSLKPTGQSFTQSKPVMINHLASRYLRVAVANLEPCVQDTLTLTTTVPSGGIVPGASEQIGSQYQVVPLSPSSTASQAQVQVTFDSCDGVTVLLPFVNGTTNAQPLPFTTSATLVHGSS